MKKHIVISLFVFFAASLAITYTATAIRSDEKIDSSENGNPTRSRSMRVRARASDRDLVAYASPSNLTKFDDLDHLIRGSIVVVRGTVEQINSHLSDDEGMIFTSCQFAVRDVLAGKSDGAENLVIRVPGGKVRFEDGKSAETRMPEFWKNPEVGEEYILVLSRDQQNNFKIRGGPQGTFKLKGGLVEPQGREDDGLTKQYKGKAIDSLLSEISRLAERDVALKGKNQEGAILCGNKADS